jgi:protein-S-isoprenylcysteine O-methyltransferase Ste14
MFKPIVFAIGSAGIVILSWPSLRNRRSHGFFRFFAFEGTLALILVNLECWFSDPFSPLQIASWVLLLGSLILVVEGFWLLGRVGKPKGGIENTTKLVTVGAYKFIRHPLYSSLLLLEWGAFFKSPSLVGGGLAVAVSVFLVLTAKVEERENLERFGEEYAEYMRRSRMFIPFVF